MIELLAISGSLRAISSNTNLLRAAALVAPEGMSVVLYEDLGNLPHYNPDLEGNLPIIVSEFRSKVRSADGLLICSPEYAHGVPGVMKNALDWLVGGDEFIEKPVALMNASPRATHAQAALLETIVTMSGRIVQEASIAVPLLARNLDPVAIAAHPEIGPAVRSAMIAFRQAIENNRIDR